MKNLVYRIQIWIRHSKIQSTIPLTRRLRGSPRPMRRPLSRAPIKLPKQLKVQTKIKTHCIYHQRNSLYTLFFVSRLDSIQKVSKWILYPSNHGFHLKFFVLILNSFFSEKGCKKRFGVKKHFRKKKRVLNPQFNVNKDFNFKT